MGKQVIATATGFYAGSRRRAGDIFTIGGDEKPAKWMEPVDAKTDKPAKAEKPINGDTKPEAAAKAAKSKAMDPAGDLV